MLMWLGDEDLGEPSMLSEEDRRYARELARLQVAAISVLARRDRAAFLRRAAMRLRERIYGEPSGPHVAPGRPAHCERTDRRSG